MVAVNLGEHPIHLGLGATAVPQPTITDLSWYLDYTERNAEDGIDGRLVSMVTFEEPWTVWEMHPNGHEVVLCTDGEIVLLQEIDDEVVETVLCSGDYAINSPGVWHTADVDEAATAVFITAGVGTRHRPRDDGESDDANGGEDEGVGDGSSE